MAEDKDKQSRTPEAVQAGGTRDGKKTVIVVDTHQTSDGRNVGRFIPIHTNEKTRVRE